MNLAILLRTGTCPAQEKFGTCGYQDRSMLDWDKLRTFREVARCGRLSTASEVLGISQSALSRQVSALEYSMSTQLFHRHARGIILTEQGSILFKAVEEMVLHLDSATARIREDKDLARGELRVTTTNAFGTLWLVPKLPKLYRDNPQLNINLLLEERILDLPMREADVAIRMKEPSEADLIRRKLMVSRLQLFASSDFIARHGMPGTPEDLKGFRLISIPAHQISEGSVLIRRVLQMGNCQHMTINNYYGVLQCVRNSVGIGILPGYLKQHFDDIANVLPEFESEEIPIYLAYPSELRDSRKLRTFRDFILNQVRTQSDE